MIEATVGLGVVLSLLFQETLGVAAGGIVVPGYVALQLDQPLSLLATFVVSFLVWILLRFISNFVFLFGRRRLVLSILLGFIFGYLSRQLVASHMLPLDPGLQAIGFVVPGLIANWMERQGIVKTISAVLICSITTRLLVMIATGGRFFPNV
ncbi:MAG: poly-gamma-glutamate biosynthesis protein PgsC [bacterium]|nr:poly-gamma-glutamate biosynthesis protein PgsC [bacterium]